MHELFVVGLPVAAGVIGTITWKLSSKFPKNDIVKNDINKSAVKTG